MNDYYALLGLPVSASREEIRTAYRKLAKRYHPDLQPGDPALKQKFIDLTQAYDVLSDETARQRYDAARIQPDPGRKADQPPFDRDWPTVHAHRNRYAYEKELLDGFYKLMAEIATSPITYCCLFVMFMLACLRELTHPT